jgi:hypothetical protein
LQRLLQMVVGQAVKHHLERLRVEMAVLVVV